MPKRRDARAPTDPIAAMQADIFGIKETIKTLQKPGASVMQFDNSTENQDPAPGELILNNQPTAIHAPASETDPMKYWHPGDTDVGGLTDAGWKAIKAQVTFPVCRARQSFGGLSTSVADGAQPELTWDRWEVSDTSVFQPRTTGGGAFATATDNIGHVWLYAPGVYSLLCAVVWGGSWGSGWDTSIMMADNYDFDDIVDHASGGKSYEDAGGAYVNHLIRTYPPHASRDSPQSNPVARIYWLLSQNSGSTKSTVYGTYMEIVYLGPFGAPVLQKTS